MTESQNPTRQRVPVAPLIRDQARDAHVVWRAQWERTQTATEIWARKHGTPLADQEGGDSQDGKQATRSEEENEC